MTSASYICFFYVFIPQLDAADMTPDPVANDVKQGFPDGSFNVGE